MSDDVPRLSDDERRQEENERQQELVNANVIHTLTALSMEVYENASQEGFHDNKREFGTCVALAHSELSEALEAHRHGCPDEEIAEELADTIIRVLDMAVEFDLDIAEALVGKMSINRHREHMHDGKAY